MTQGELALLALPEFLAHAEALPKECRAKLIRILRLLIQNRRHPSLQTKKLKGEKHDVFECRVDQTIRLIYDNPPGMLRCWYVGAHDSAIGVGVRMARSGILVDDIEIETVPEAASLVHEYACSGSIPEFVDVTSLLLNVISDE